MKKVLLTAMTLLSVAASSAFGFYGANADWIDLITEGNVFKARADRLGFALGNGTIKGVFGFKVENEGFGLFYNKEKGFSPTVSGGIAYRTDAFGIGVGYNYTYKYQGRNHFDDNKGLNIHTPVISMNFLNDRIRLAVPVQVAIKSTDVGGTKTDYTGVSLDPQIRFYTGIDAVKEIRLTVKYGMNEEKDTISGTTTTDKASSFGFDFRTYFGAQVGDVGLSPFIKVTYDTALDKGANCITAGSMNAKDTKTEINSWRLEVLPTLGMSANSDVVNIYVEAGLGYLAQEDGRKASDIEHALRWNAYGELYVRPIKDLEWYVEAEIGNGAAEGSVYAGSAKTMQFNGSTGINWYLPSFGGDAQ